MRAEILPFLAILACLAPKSFISYIGQQLCGSYVSSFTVVFALLAVPLASYTMFQALSSFSSRVTRPFVFLSTFMVLPVVTAMPWTKAATPIPPPSASFTELLTVTNIFLVVATVTATIILALVTYVTLANLVRTSNPKLPPLINPKTSFGTSRLLTFLEFSASPLKMITRLYADYGPVFTLSMFGQNITLLVGPEATEPFFKSPDSVLSQSEVYGFMKPVFGEGVVYDCPARTRQTQFQAMAFGLRSARLRTYVEKISAEAEAFFRTRWSENTGTRDLLADLSELTIMTASRCLHGDDVRENMYEQVANLYFDLDHGVTPLSVFWCNAPTEAHKKRDIARKRMVELFGKVIKQRRMETPEEAKAKNRTDILDVFMNAKYKDGSMMSDSEVTGLLIALLFAGQHTSSISSTWTAMFIAHHSSITDRVNEEQTNIMKDGRTLDYDAVNEMDLMHNCMREALRLHPPLVLLMRKVLKDIKVNAGGRSYDIPKGDTVMISPSVGMRLESVFPKADTFDPDRYGPGREEHKIPYAYLGFGGGMHSCMGNAFAFVQVKTILSVLFRHYNISLTAGKLPECDYEAMVVGPKGDCRVNYTKKATV